MPERDNVHKPWRAKGIREQARAFAQHLAAAGSAETRKRDSFDPLKAIALRAFHSREQFPKSRRRRSPAETLRLNVAANVFYDAIAQQHFHLHFLNQVVPFFNAEEAFDLTLIDLLF